MFIYYKCTEEKKQNYSFAVDSNTKMNENMILLYILMIYKNEKHTFCKG